MKTRITLMAILGLCLSLSINAQETIEFSLEEAVKYGLTNNVIVKNAQTDIEIARKKIVETTAIGLPQVNGKITNTNYIDIPTTLLPDFITPSIFAVNEDNFGLTPVVEQGEVQFFPVNFGTKHNATAEISVSQLIFNGSYLVGLQAAKAYLEQSKVQAIKSEIEITEYVTRAYFLTLLAQENKGIIDRTLESLNSLYEETQKVYEQGFIEDTEVDQLKLMLDDLKTSQYYVNNQIQYTNSFLKAALGIEVEQEITLTDKLDDLLEVIKIPNLVSSDLNYLKNIDYRILENQRELSKLDLKNEKAKSLPVLSAFFTAQTNAMRDEFNFTNDEQWYPSTLWGFQMDIPIFSSLSRSSRVQQKKLELKKVNEIEVDLKNTLKTDEINFKTDFSNTLSIHENKKNASKLAFKIYSKTQVKYKEGVSSSMDLLQAYNQYLEAEGSYIGSILDLVNAKLALEKLFAE